MWILNPCVWILNPCVWILNPESWILVNPESSCLNLNPNESWNRFVLLSSVRFPVAELAVSLPSVRYAVPLLKAHFPVAWGLCLYEWCMMSCHMANMTSDVMHLVLFQCSVHKNSFPAQYQRSWDWKKVLSIRIWDSIFRIILASHSRSTRCRHSFYRFHQPCKDKTTVFRSFGSRWNAGKEE